MMKQNEENIKMGIQHKIKKQIEKKINRKNRQNSMNKKIDGEANSVCIGFQFFLRVQALLQSYSISIQERFFQLQEFYFIPFGQPVPSIASFSYLRSFHPYKFAYYYFFLTYFSLFHLLIYNAFSFSSLKVFPNDQASSTLQDQHFFPIKQLIPQVNDLLFKVFNSIFYNINQKMNSENVWVMFYVHPQFNCFPILNVKPQSILSVQKVEIQNQVGNNEIVQEISLPKHEVRYQKAIHSSRIQFKDSEDSSFYVPEKKEAKIGQQKLGRNSVSNILRVFTKLLKTPHFRGKYQKLKQYYEVQISWKQFNSWVTGIGLNTNKYIRIKRMLNGIKSKPHFGRILCILFKIFVCGFSRNAILTSSKTEVKNIMPSLSQIRNIQQEIIQALSQSISQISAKREKAFD